MYLLVVQCAVLPHILSFCHFDFFLFQDSPCRAKLQSIRSNRTTYYEAKHRKAQLASSRHGLPAPISASTEKQNTLFKRILLLYDITMHII